MSRLVPGYQRLAEEDLSRQAAIHRIGCLPWSPALAAGAIHIINTGDQAADWGERLHREPVSMLGVDTEFTFDRAPISLRNGKEFVDKSTIRPQVCTVAAWCGATAAPSTIRG